ncbi:hypothetical protein GCM10023094_33200 [Rhodococcus olei]|uniref:Alternate signal-mediated exported protein n=1 Tax=Rhodococcus olei TaxID=2161675 RepID=A0ABP8P9H1_9NOCA
MREADLAHATPSQGLPRTAARGLHLIETEIYMSRSSMRRLTAVAASGALVAAGAVVGLGLGTGVASAADTCSQSSHAEKNDISTWGITHTYDRSVNTAEAAGGTQVTYKTVIGTTGIGNPYVNTITEFPPAGFGAPVKSTITAYTVSIPTGQHTEDVTGVPNGNGWKFTSTGWFVNSGNPVTLETTYLVPKNATPGSAITSGGVGVAGTVGVGTELPNLTACFKVRIPNAGESVLSVANETGLGSADGQLSSTGSVSDILGDTILKVLSEGNLS